MISLASMCCLEGWARLGDSSVFPKKRSLDDVHNGFIQVLFAEIRLLEQFLVSLESLVQERTLHYEISYTFYDLSIRLRSVLNTLSNRFLDVTE